MACLLAIGLGGAALRAADPPPVAAKGLNADLVGVDLDKNTLTFKTTQTLPLAADVKVRGEDNKAETLKQFKDNMAKEDDKSIYVVEDADGTHVAAVRDLPAPDNRIHAALVSVDLDKNTVAFKTKDKDGKETETTLPVAQDAKVYGEDNKPETLKQFKENMDKEDDKSILIVEDASAPQIVSIADLPPEEIKLKAALVSVDLDKGLITFKAKGKDGKEAETTLPLAKDAKVRGEDNKPETLKQFKDAMDKEDDKSIFVIEEPTGKQIVSLRDLPAEEKHYHAALVSVDPDKNTITFKHKHEGKDVEKTLPLAATAKVFGEDNKPETLQQFKEAMDKEDDKSILVVADPDGRQITALTDLPPEGKKYNAALVAVDLDKNTITFETQTTLPLAKDVKVYGEDGKPETLKQFKENMDKEDDKSIVVVEAADGKHVAAVTDLPPKK